MESNSPDLQGSGGEPNLEDLLGEENELSPPQPLPPLPASDEEGDDDDRGGLDLT